jgi:hypothetical protein
MPDIAKAATLPDNYVHALFQRCKETHFEQMLLMVFARNLDLAQVILSDQLPKGQRTFSENDVREFIEQFNKQEMHIHFLVAKNAILSRSLPAPVLDNYESALRDLLNEVARAIGERGLAKEAEEVKEVKEDVSRPEVVSTNQVSLERRRQRPATPMGPARRLFHLVVSPLWHVMFPLPVLLGWLAEIPTWPLLEIALFTSAAFAVAHRKRGWQAWMTLGGLGSLLNMLVVLPIALWDWQQIGFPLLLHAQAVPQWVNASLWGIMCVVAFDALYNMLILVVRTPLGNILPPWVRTLPLAASSIE